MSDLPSLISEGRRLIAEATEGPWKACDDEDGSPVVCVPPNHGGPIAGNCAGGPDGTSALFLTFADRDLIVFAVTNLPLLLAVAEAAALAVQDLGNVLYNIETGERRAAEEQATEIRAALDAALRGEVKP